MGDRCNKCRVSRRAEGNTWCLGCLSWESLERELTGSWCGPAGLRVIADNLVLGAAREVRALRALGAGLGLAPSAGAGSSSLAPRAPVVKEESPAGATPKSKAEKAAGDKSEDYASEESEEEEPLERDQLALPVSPPVLDPRPELPRRSRPAEEERERVPRERREEREKAQVRRSRSRRRREENKEKRKEKDPDRKRDRRDPEGRGAERSDRPEEKRPNKKKKKRGGRKHKRLSRLEQDPYRAIHRSLDQGLLDRRERLDRHPLP